MREGRRSQEPRLTAILDHGFSSGIRGTIAPPIQLERNRTGRRRRPPGGRVASQGQVEPPVPLRLPGLPAAFCLQPRAAGLLPPARYPGAGSPWMHGPLGGPVDRSAVRPRPSFRFDRGFRPRIGAVAAKPGFAGGFARACGVRWGGVRFCSLVGASGSRAIGGRAPTPLEAPYVLGESFRFHRGFRPRTGACAAKPGFAVGFARACAVRSTPGDSREAAVFAPAYLREFLLRPALARDPPLTTGGETPSRVAPAPEASACPSRSYTRLEQSLQPLLSVLAGAPSPLGRREPAGDRSSRATDRWGARPSPARSVALADRSVGGSPEPGAIGRISGPVGGGLARARRDRSH